LGEGHSLQIPTVPTRPALLAPTSCLATEDFGFAVLILRGGWKGPWKPSHARDVVALG
jgi:hypothetical protein